MRTGYEKSRPWPCQEKQSLQIDLPALNFEHKLGSQDPVAKGKKKARSQEQLTKESDVATMKTVE